MKKTWDFLADLKERILTKPELVFVLGTSLFGLLLALMVPPFQVPDELVHFTRAYEVSELKMPQKHDINGTNHLGSMLPTSILVTYKDTDLRQVAKYPDVPHAKKYPLSSTKAALKIPLDKANTSFIETGGGSPSYFPLLYIPQSTAILVLKVLNAPVIVMLYATRIVGLIVWMALALVAFRYVSPASRKLPLAAILLLPMFISQASASTDPIINGFIVVYLALITNLIHRGVRASPLQIGGLVAMLSLATLSKPVYAIFGLLLLLIPKSLTNWKVIAKSATLLTIPVMAVAAWGLAAKVSAPYYSNAIAISNAEPMRQIKYVLPNVINFFQPFFNSTLLNWSDGIYTSVIGTFGKLDAPLPLLFVVLGYVVILLTIVGGVACGTNDKKTDAASARRSPMRLLVSAVLVSGYVVGVYLAMYIASTPPESKIVTGVQGRYFLPLLPFGVLFAAKGFIVFRSLASYRNFLLASSTILLTASVVTIFLRYYIVYP